MPREEFSNKVKVEAFLRSNGRCEECGGVLRPGKFHYDHKNPSGLTGKGTLGNCAVLCRECHAEKTNKHDIPNIAKAKRRQQRHLGIRKPSSFRGWRRFNGEIRWNNR